MSKVWKDNDNSSLIVKIGVGIVLLLFILFGFVIKQDCDIDKVYLWCRLHPMSLFDIIGMILFFGGAVVLTGILPLKLTNEANSSKWNIILFVVMALGIVLIWNL